MVAPAGRSFASRGRGRTNIIINNRYGGSRYGYRYGYGFGRPYRTYASPGFSIGLGYGSPYYGYRYGYPYASYAPYYGYSYPYTSGYGSYGYYGDTGYATADYDAYGWIRLKVRPRHADVFVDGYYVGVVDDYDGAFQRLRLAAGPHQIEISAPGFAPLTFDVRILPDRKTVYEQQLLPLP